MKYLLLLLLFLITISQSTQQIKQTDKSNVINLSLILVSGPKKRPELKKSINDLSNAMNNMPEGLKVSEIVFVKGCLNDCNHPDFDYAIDLIQKNHPNIKITTPHFIPTPQDGITLDEWVLDTLSSVWKRTSKLATDWTEIRYQKHMTINYYFIEAMKYVYKETDSDYVLLSEDDQTYKENTFSSVLELMKTNNKNRIFSKISWDQNGWYVYKVVERLTARCKKNFVHGAYGVLRSRKELRMFLKWVKFSRRFESEDSLGHYLCEFMDGVVEVKHCSLHFGWLKEIPK